MAEDDVVPGVTLPEIFTEEDFDTLNTEAAAQDLKDKKAAEEGDDSGVLESSNPQVVALREALRLSESARRDAESSRSSTPAPAPAPARQEARAADMFTDEQLAALVEEKGMVAALRAVQGQTIRHLEQQYGPQLEAARTGGVGAAERLAAQEFPVEFELFGEEIRAAVANAQDKSIFNTPQGWENLVAWVRGKKGNIDKYIEKVSGKREDNGERARETQRNSTGFQTRSTAVREESRVGSDNEYGLDNTERKVADTMGISYKEYAKWKRMG